MPSNSTVCHSRGRNRGQTYRSSIGWTAAQGFSFRFTGSLVRGRASDSLRRIEPAFCPEQIRALLRAAGVADVAGEFFFAIVREGGGDSCPDRLAGRAFFSPRHTADERCFHIAALKVCYTT